MTQAKGGDTVKVHYIGKLDDGEVFDSSDESGLLEFKVGDEEFIPGLDDAVIGMVPGESKTVRIPADRAYGLRADDLRDARCGQQHGQRGGQQQGEGGAVERPGISSTSGDWIHGTSVVRGTAVGAAADGIGSRDAG